MKLTRAQWLEERKTYIGASEAAAVCRLHPYDTPRHVWMVKKGLIEVEDNLPMKIGRLLENTVAQEFAKAVGIRPQALHKSGLVRHEHLPFIGANPDRRWKRSPVQLKTCNQYASGDFGKIGTDEVKDEYLVQVGQEMLVCKAEVGYLGVLIGNNDFRWYVFTWTEAMKAVMKNAVEEMEHWWHDYYLKDVPPPLMGHERDTEIVRDTYREHNGDLRTLTPDVEEIIKDWPTLQAQHDELAKELLRRKNLLREFIGHHAGAQNDIGEPVAFWKADKNGKRSLRLKFEKDAA